MELWYTRSDSPGTRWSVKVTRPLLSGEGSKGRVDVAETEDLGRVLLAGGLLVLAEAEDFAHREMLVHTPLNAHPNVRSVLVVGGGDGGATTELLRYPGVERIVVVDQDELLVEAADRFFPETARALRDPRVRLERADGSDFVRDSKERFDLVLVERSAAESAPGQSFFCDCFRILSGDGILVEPCGSAFYQGRRRELMSATGKLKRLFPVFRLFHVESPAGAPGRPLYGFASKKHDPLRDLDAERWARLGIATRYYDPEVHKAAFALPRYEAEVLEGA
jgi:spermidine synthase